MLARYYQDGNHKCRRYPCLSLCLVNCQSPNRRRIVNRQTYPAGSSNSSSGSSSPAGVTSLSLPLFPVQSLSLVLVINTPHPTPLHCTSFLSQPHRALCDAMRCDARCDATVTPATNHCCYHIDLKWGGPQTTTVELVDWHKQNVRLFNGGEDAHSRLFLTVRRR